MLLIFLWGQGSNKKLKPKNSYPLYSIYNEKCPPQQKVIVSTITTYS